MCQYHSTAATGRGCSAGTRRFAWQPADDRPAGSLGPVTQGAERTRWKIRSDRLVDETPQVRLSIASLELASGLTFEQYVMRLPRCAMTVVLDDAAERILLIWRHRFIIDRWMWELPGGYIDPGEDGIAAAAREVEEETGYRPRSIEPIMTFQPMAGSADSAHELYLARGADRVGVPLADEAEEVRWIPLADLPGLIATGWQRTPPCDRPCYSRRAHSSADPSSVRR
jgi:8-oxo-dGTP pyrophosphatase MutT (NUDIX family)